MLSDGQSVVGTIDAHIYAKYNFQDNLKYIIRRQAKRRTMEKEKAIDVLKNLIGEGRDVQSILAITESLLQLVKDGVMTVDEVLDSIGDLSEELGISISEEEWICIVRRLTPTETSRLQGFPDGYTMIDGPDTSDGPQFKSHGNSWAVPCAQFVNDRMEMEIQRLGHEGTIRYATVCSGIEAHSVSVRNRDWRCLFFSEIEPFPCRVLEHHYPTVPNLGDMTQIHYDAEKGVITNVPEDGYELGREFKVAPLKEVPYEVGELDVFSGGTPCFTAGHRILTKDGEKNIEDIKVGDVVYTHKGNLCKVVKTGNKVAPVWRMAFRDGTSFTVTADHPFLALTRNSHRHDWFTVSMINTVLSHGHDVLCAKFCPDSSEGYEYSRVIYACPLIQGIEFKSCIEERESVTDTVYNIEVERDHSYICNGFCVHNCTDVSIAGKREGMAEDSGTRSSLAWHYQRIIDDLRPKFTLWENVCFGADTLITTDNGHKRIADIKEGDYVRSFDGTCHRVEKTFRTKDKETIRLTVMGAEPIEVTPNHPFFACKKLPNKNSCGKREFSTPEWIPAGELTQDHYIAYKLDDVGSKSIGMAHAYAVGRWLADGSVVLRSARTHNGKHGGQRARIFISTGWKKHDALARELSRLPYKINESKIKDYAINFTFTSDSFYELIKECGKGARNKKVPQYVYSLIPEEQKELIRGYLDGDGHLHRETEMTYRSSSRELAIGIARLIRDTYHRRVSVRRRGSTGKTVIEGRIVNAHENWFCSFGNSSVSDKRRETLKSSVQDGFVWCPVRSIASGKKQTVYNLTVADTHTYEANDVVVHNCGTFSSNGGADFIWFVNRCAESGYAMAWRTLDAQYVTTEEFPRAVPQRRRRIWMVGYRGNDWRIPARIVFELEKDLTVNPPERIPGIGFKEITEEGRQLIAKLDKEEEALSQTPNEEHMFGLTFESDDGRADLLHVSRMIDFSEMSEESDFSKVPMTDILIFAKKVGEPGYIGSVIRTDKKKKKIVEDTADLFSMLEDNNAPKDETTEVPAEDEDWVGAEKITPAILENIGNAGILANGRICTLNCHEWTSGIQLSPKTYNAWEELVCHKEWLKANDLLPEAFDETVCGLQDVLEENPDEKYNLSWRACFGILKRAETRGKELPEALYIALICTIRDNAGIVKWVAINGRVTKKKDTDLTERESAKVCFDKYIAPVAKWDDIEAVPPKKRADDDEDDDDEEISEEDLAVDEDGNPIE